MKNEEAKRKILKFLKEFSDCVIATTDKKGNPEAATVGYCETDDFKISFGTSKKSRKYLNLQKNPCVAMVFGFSGDVTVQYEGVAKELKGEILRERLKIHFVKIPSAEQYNNDPEQTYFIVEPTWVRITDYSDNPEVLELRRF